MEAARDERWIRSWINICGSLLALGFLLSFMVPLDRLPYPLGKPVNIFVSLILAVVAVTMGNRVTGLPKAAGICGMGIVTLILHSFMGSIHPDGAPEVFLLGFPVLGLGVAVGNHLRKRHPGSMLARSLAGSAGAALVIAVAVPASSEGKPLGYLLWSNGGGGGLLLLSLLLAYGAAAAGSFVPFKNPRALCRVIGVLGWVLMLAGPTVLGIEMRRDRRGEAVAAFVAFSILAYGHLLLVAVTAADWIDLVLWRRYKVVTDAAQP